MGHRQFAGERALTDKKLGAPGFAIATVTKKGTRGSKAKTNKKMAEATHKPVRKCHGSEAEVSYAVLIFLTAWIVALAGLGVTLASQNDPSQSLKSGVFWFSVLTFPALLLGTVIWIGLGRCTVEKLCQAREAELEPSLA